MGYLLTLDLGTTSVKACVFNENFDLLGYSSEEYELLTSEGNIVELTPETYWQAAISGIRKATELSGITGMDTGIITITTQGETLLPVDSSGAPLRNAINWLDARAEEEAAYINNRFTNEEVYGNTGLPEIGPACPVCKVLWIKNKEPEIYGKTFKFMLLEDFIILRLTGKYVTEKCLMSSTGYFDINKEVLWMEMLSYAGIEPEKFPQIMDCGTIVGGLLPEVADELGINPGIRVSTGAMDQAASAIGAGNVTEGIITETTGTALVMAATIKMPDYSNPARLNIMKHGLKGKYIMLPYNSTAGIVLKWFKDEFCRYETEKYAEEGKSVYLYLDELAESSPPLANGLILLPHFAGMLTPEINPAVKGVFFGVGLDTRKPHFIRAILEGIAFMLKQNVELLEQMGIEVKEIRSLGGGSKSRLWCQLKADVNNRVIHTMEQEETTSLGAAILGSLAAGIYRTVEEACRVVKVKKSFKPDEKTVSVYAKGYVSYKQLYTSLKKMF
ncbi:MAG: hypothetical protein A2Y21_06065 [Clostridiales bacterium GWC2_40_7]|nr:MAG: hypothetical protein A2Y21_06065 [Clostridiales bacterium GWC2_40_7]